MPHFGPLKHNDLVRYLGQLGFEGPFSGGKHQFMIRNIVRLTLPNIHKGDISKEILARILRQARITRDEWDKL